VATYTFTPPTQPPTHDAGEVKDYLISRGVAVTDVSTQLQGDGVTQAYVIEADTDPTPFFSTWTPPPRPVDQARQFIKNNFAGLTDTTLTAQQRLDLHGTMIRSLIVLLRAEQ
jgi:hypothetical protein